jgi:4-diphosphocytidyl-2-C-methyl-D-erythritol kinase
VGADVPFFFARSAAWVEGVGETVRPVSGIAPVWLVLVHPGVFLSTAKVFSRWNIGLTSPIQPPTIAQFSFQGLLEGLRNDLQTAATELEPAVGTALDVLATAGAPVCLMSGSGSAVFGVFPGEFEARRVAARVAADPEARGWRVKVVDTLQPGAFPFLEH